MYYFIESRVLMTVKSWGFVSFLLLVPHNLKFTLSMLVKRVELFIEMYALFFHIF